jgi:uncharacterized membrane protein YGL010W
MMILPAPPFPSSSSSLPWGLLASHVVTAFMFGLCVKTCWYEFGNVESALAFYGVYHRAPWNQIIHFFGVPCILGTVFIFTAPLVVFLPLPTAITTSTTITTTTTTTTTVSSLPVFKAIKYHGIKIPPLPGGIPSHYVSWSTLLLILYFLFYLSMDVVGAMLYFPFMYCLYAMAICWTAQDHAQQAAVELKQFDRTNKKKHEDATRLSSSSLSPIRLPSPPPHPPHHCWYGTGRLLQQAAMVHLLSWYFQIHWGHYLIEGAAPAVWQSVGGALTTAPLFAFYEGLWYVGLQSDLQHRVTRLVVQDYSTLLLGLHPEDKDNNNKKYQE